MIKEKTRKNKKFRGSVLFTTVSVLALLIIFLTGALAFASSANHRAHKSYASSQASYNARAAIDSFTEAMRRDPGVAAAVHDMGSSTLYPEITVTGDTSNWGEIGYYDSTGNWVSGKIEVAPVNTNAQYSWDATLNNNAGEWVKLTQFKITATARYGKEEETVVAYIKTRMNTIEESASIKGLQLTGDGNFANGGDFYGGLGVGLSGDADATDYVCTFKNSVNIDCELVMINADVASNTSSFNLQILKPEYEVVVLGDFLAQSNSNSLITVDYALDPNTTSVTPQDIPYMYVHKLLEIGASLNNPVVNSSNSPFNIFAGYVKWRHGELAGADLYLMDDDKTSEIGGNTSSSLLKWTTSVVEKLPDGTSSYGGNVFCNGSLKINQSDKPNAAEQSFTTNGDVRVEHDCYIANNVTIGGSLIVGGDLYIGEDAYGNKGALTCGSKYISNTSNVYHRVYKDGYSEVQVYSYNGEVLGIQEYKDRFDSVAAAEEAIAAAKIDSWVQYLAVDWNNNIIGAASWSGDTEKLTKTTTTMIQTPDGSLITEEAAELERYDIKAYTDEEIAAMGFTRFEAGTKSIYPSGMTREEIYGGIDESGAFTAANSSTKIVTTLSESREALGIDAAGHVDTVSYDAEKLLTDNKLAEIVETKAADGTVKKTIVADTRLLAFKNDKIKDKYDADDVANYGDSNKYKTGETYNSNDIWAEKQIDGKTYKAIVNSCVISGTIEGNGKLKDSDGQEYNSKYITDDIYIYADHDMYIYLDNAFLYNGPRLVVYNGATDDSNASSTVTFIIGGELKFNGETSIINYCVYDGAEISYEKDFGMMWYGLPDSKITMGNETTLVGSFRAPYTKCDSQSKTGKISVKYTPESGGTKTSSANIIGNAMFDTSDGLNNFGVLYTSSGSNAGSGGQSQSIYSATGDFYELSYFAAS